MKDLGILVPIVTPCTGTGNVDTDALRSVARHMMEAGCTSIFVAGSTGRGPWFSRKERQAMCAAVLEEVGPKVPLFAGCMASGLTEMVENAHAMEDVGANIAVLTAPGYFIYSQQEIEAIFLKFADRSPLPVIVYDIPAFAGLKLDTKMVRRLAEHGNIIGFKDSSGIMEPFKDLIATLADKRDFYVLQGKEFLLADSLFAGASGFVVSLLHVDPKPFAALYRAARAGEWDRAARMQENITEVVGLVEASFKRRPETSTLFHFLNQTLRRRGVCENILLDHEGECPEWLADNAERALAICAEAVSA